MNFISKEDIFEQLNRAEMAEEVTLPISYFRDLLYQALNGITEEMTEQQDQQCKCSMRTKLAGDGCAVCNPELAEDLSNPEPQAQAGEPTGCACRWDKDDNRVQTCERHQGWLDVIHEWAERAKSAEAALAKKDEKEQGLRQALKACVEALRTYDMIDAQALAALTQGQEAME